MSYTPYDNQIRGAAEKYGIPLEEAYALFDTESDFNPNAVTPTGATGLGQLVKGTASDLGLTPEQRYDPDLNIDASLRYYAQMRERFGPEDAYRAYNTGPRTVAEGRYTPEGIKAVPRFQRKLDKWSDVFSGAAASANEGYYPVERVSEDLPPIPGFNEARLERDLAAGPKFAGAGAIPPEAALGRQTMPPTQLPGGILQDNGLTPINPAPGGLLSLGGSQSSSPPTQMSPAGAGSFTDTVSMVREQIQPTPANPAGGILSNPDASRKVNWREALPGILSSVGDFARGMSAIRQGRYEPYRQHLDRMAAEEERRKAAEAAQRRAAASKGLYTRTFQGPDGRQMGVLPSGQAVVIPGQPQGQTKPPAIQTMQRRGPGGSVEERAHAWNPQTASFEPLPGSAWVPTTAPDKSWVTYQIPGVGTKTVIRDKRGIMVDDQGQPWHPPAGAFPVSGADVAMTPKDLGALNTSDKVDMVNRSVQTKQTLDSIDETLRKLQAPGIQAGPLSVLSTGANMLADNLDDLAGTTFGDLTRAVGGDPTLAKHRAKSTIKAVAQLLIDDGGRLSDMDMKLAQELIGIEGALSERQAIDRMKQLRGIVTRYKARVDSEFEHYRKTGELSANTVRAQEHQKKAAVPGGLRTTENLRRTREELERRVQQDLGGR